MMYPDTAIVSATHGQVPTAHVLRSALRAARALDASGTPVVAVHGSYTQLPTGGLYHYDDLTRGEQLLVESGLVCRTDNVLYPSTRLQYALNLREEEALEILLLTVLAEQPPLWLSAAARDDTVSSELIPDGDLSALTQIVPDPVRREALLLALGRRYRPESDTETGELGEECVLAKCRARLADAGRSDLAEQVQRVSLVSDQLGYDIIAPTLSGVYHRIEVKTTRSSKEVFEISISRNEAEVGVRDPSWAMVVCRIDPEDIPSIIGWCRGDALRSVLPNDIDARARWMSAALALLPSQLTPGLPPL